MRSDSGMVGDWWRLPKTTVGRAAVAKRGPGVRLMGKGMDRCVGGGVWSGWVMGGLTINSIRGGVCRLCLGNLHNNFFFLFFLKRNFNSPPLQNLVIFIIILYFI